MILLSASAVTAMAWTAAGTGVGVLLARLFGWSGNAPIPWASLTLAGGLAGVGLGWPRRLDLTAAARWLDRRLRLDEALSAALFCLERGCSGPLDDAVVARAAAVGAQQPTIHWPWRYLCHRSLLAAGLMILSGLAVTFWRLDKAATAAFPARGPAIRQDARASAPEIPPAVSSPREVARILFAQDPGLARQAEGALQAGDTELLRRLLGGAERKIQDRIAQAATPGERRLLEQEQLRQREMGAALLGEDTTAETGSVSEQDREASAGQRRDRGRTSPRTGGEGGAGQPEPQDQDMVRRRQDFQRDPGFTGPSGSGGPGESTHSMSGTGLQAGRGSGQSQSQWGEIKGQSGPEQAPIDSNQDLTLEYILPGKNARVPLSQAVAEARRTAESAVARAGVPLEYLEAIRAYFLALSQATTAPGHLR